MNDNAGWVPPVEMDKTIERYREEIARILTPYFRHWKQMDEKRKVIEQIQALFPPELWEKIDLTRDICPECEGKGWIPSGVNDMAVGVNEQPCPNPECKSGSKGD